MKTTLRRFTVALMLLALLGAACSSSKTKEGEEETDVVPPSADAGTDVVPGTPAEDVPPPGADSAAKPSDAPTPKPEDPASAGLAPLAIPTSLPSPSPTPAPTDMPVTPALTPPTSAPSPVAPAPEAVAPMVAPPIAASAPDTSLGDYTVQQGDTLMKIAYENYGNLYKWKAIYEANKDKISDPRKLTSGVILKLEKPLDPVQTEQNGEKYYIKKGDTLGKISSSVYGTPTKWKKIWKNNKKLIRNPNKIFAGFYLYYVADNTPSIPNSTVGSGNGMTTPALATHP